MVEKQANKWLQVGGAPEGWDAYLIADLVKQTQKPVIHVARSAQRVRELSDALAFFAPDIPVLEFPAWDCLPYDRVSPNPDICALRMATLCALTQNPDIACVVLTTINASMQKIPARSFINSVSFSAKVGKHLSFDDLLKTFATMGFSRTSTVQERGEFAVRGGIIDVFPAVGKHPIRLDLFGSVLESARTFDPDTQRTIHSINSVEIAPVSEVPFDPNSISRFRQAYRLAFGAATQTEDPLFEAVSEGRRHQGMEHWLPLFFEEMATLFDYMPQSTVTLDYQTQDVYATRWENINDAYEARRSMQDTTGKSRGLTTPVYKPLEPEELYLALDDWKEILSKHPVRQFSPHHQPPGVNVIDAGARIGRTFVQERQQGGNIFDALADHIKAERQKKKRVVIASYSEGARDRLQSLLEEHDLPNVFLADKWTDVNAKTSLVVWALEQGFETTDTTVISEQDVLGERLIRRGKKKKSENILSEASALSINDLIVHVDHGIGRYLGLETVTALGAPHDCLVLEYANDSKLYLPVENIELLSRYGGTEGAQLDRLGSGAWQAKKAKLKNRIRDIADKLLKVAAERALREGQRINPPDTAYEEFCAKFPYEETEDQLNAIEDTLNDLGSGSPMDRLICGDVGFGKTEVAIRAAFVAAMTGLQVALICPTTLLSRQHFMNFEERFKGLPLTVRQLSKFVTQKEASQTRKGLEDGSVDIVIGTHALLSKGIAFKNLGLLIIDEEQHFGVTHKERLKELRADVHVLTMTATPIPRTLQLAMSGVRDLSLITTPPVDRLSIRTYVAEFDPIMIREALLREHYRGGQAFYIVPRIKDIKDVAEFLTDHVPEIKFEVATGKMSADELDDKMNAFYDGKFDVLLATTIVESGLDIPTANTMIIHRADMFGLSQLYQIRGRVGRSKVRAYAYLTTQPRKQMTETAEKRLRILGNLDELGAGFTLASHDLDIRGAGNLLGDEQSGHIREVGYELYQEMLQETIQKLKTEKDATAKSDEDTDTWSPQIHLGVPVLIPEDYISDLDVRMSLYRRLSFLETQEELEGFAAELHDRFGKPPVEVEMLLRVVRIKAMCRKAGIAQIDAGEKGAVVTFHKNFFRNPKGLLNFIHAENGNAKLRSDHKVVIKRDWQKKKLRVKGSFLIAKELAKIAVDM